MSEIEISRRSALGGMLADCASAVETAIVGVLTVVLEDEKLDEEVQDIIHTLRTRSHRLRRIAAALAKER